MELRNDKLFCWFTAWLKVVIKHAKVDYIRNLKRHIAEVPIKRNEFIDKLIYSPINDNTGYDDKFIFEDKSLYEAYQKLSPHRRKVLELNFIYNLTPEEIADELHCSIGHIYNMRSLALNELKMAICKKS